MKRAFESLINCDGVEDVELYGIHSATQASYGPLVFKEDNTEPFIFNDNHVGRWTIEAVNLNLQNLAVER